jgi:hypothetical protein
MTERWRDIPDYPGYQASDQGRIRSVHRLVVCRDGRIQHHRGKILKGVPNDKGYLRVGLQVNLRQHLRYVHDLVLEAFVGPRPAGMHGCHADDDKINNRPDNLSWQTPIANEQAKVRAGRHNNGWTTETAPEQRTWATDGRDRREYFREYRQRNGDRIRERDRARDRQRRGNGNTRYA